MADLMGPWILARTMSVPTRRGSSDRAWQYHSRSDNHSTVACWTMLFDLLRECDVLRKHAQAGQLGFAINHVMVGPINKTLDMVVTIVPPTREQRPRTAFADLVARYGIALSESEQHELSTLPNLYEDHQDDMSEVAIAVEAKACMTEHVKSLPRLHAEVLATGYLAKKASPRSITVSYSLVNCAETFVSPGVKGEANRHNQPADAQRVVAMLRSAVPLARDASNIGYDVIGVVVIDCKNDGSTVTVSAGPAAPAKSDHHHYERMIRSTCSEYRGRFNFR